MTGLSIFIHSIRLLLRNFVPALRIGFVVLAVISVMNITLTNQMNAEFGAMDSTDLELMNPPTFPWVIWAITILVSIVGYLWVAVAWHRFVLLEENPGAFLPRFNGRQMFAYLIKGTLIGLIMIALMIPVMILISIMASTVGVFLFMVFLPALITIPVTYIFYRLGMVLPTAAIGKQMTFGQSWTATKPHTRAIFVLTIVIALIYAAFGLMSFMFGVNPIAAIASGGSSVLSSIVSALVNWISIFIGISILTTLYGSIVEGRELG